MVIIDKPDCFNIEEICLSGQCFRMSKEEDGRYRVIAGDKCVYIDDAGDKISFNCSEDEFNNFWYHYFDLDTDYRAIIDSIDKNDKYLTEAAEFGSGIRILNQDLWEMIVSFLISQQNNIKRIRKCIGFVSEMYGKKCIDCEGREYYAIPQPEALVGLPEDGLMCCNLGYRSKYVVRSAGQVLSGEINLDYIKSLDYEYARAELLKLYGVGKKVADCICLFALHHMDAFPVDTHINKVLSTHYKDGFPFERYKSVNGVMQQYVFYYDLMGNN